LFSCFLLIAMMCSLHLKSESKTKQASTLNPWILQNLWLNPSNNLYYIQLNGNGDNYSTQKIPSNHPWNSPDNWVNTTWTAINIDPTTFLVNNGDFTFSSSTGWSGHYASSATGCCQVPYGTAFGCQAPYDADGIGMIDLTGTNWMIDDSWVYGGYLPYGTSSITNNAQQATIMGGGYCGWNAPIRAAGETAAYTGGAYLKLKLKCASTDIQIGTDCYAPMNGAASFAVGQQYVIQATNILNSQKGVVQAYPHFMSESTNTKTLSNGDNAAMMCGSAAPDAMNPSDATINSNNVITVASVIASDTATFKWMDGNDVLFNSDSPCQGYESTARFAQDGTAYDIFGYSNAQNCGQTQLSLNTANLDLNGDHVSSCKKIVYQFNIFMKYN